MPAHQSRNSIHHHNGRPGCCNDRTRTPFGPDSGQHESKPGITGPQARSCDIYKIKSTAGKGDYPAANYNQQSCGKVMFLHLSVSHSVSREGVVRGEGRQAW